MWFWIGYWIYWTLRLQIQIAIYSGALAISLLQSI
jgi:hypothetical protein